MATLVHDIITSTVTKLEKVWYYEVVVLIKRCQLMF